MLNVRSDYLVILVATYNRLNLLKRTLRSIASSTRCSQETIVIDGGSTDGTIEYLRSHPAVTSVFQGTLLGTARCYNKVWRQIESRYTCWLSDDTEVVPGSLDLAVDILQASRDIGMVGLKMKDVVGPWKSAPYMGALSEYGILNCNHGVLPTDLLRSVGYFNEGYRSYTIDPDLTASILCSGRKVVMTKRVSVLHHREWAEHEGTDKIMREMRGIDNARIYRRKFEYLAQPRTLSLARRLKNRIFTYLERILPLKTGSDSLRFGLNRRDFRNVTCGRFIRLSDPLKNRKNPYHLVQSIPTKFLAREANPYCHLFSSNGAGDFE